MKLRPGLIFLFAVFILFGCLSPAFAEPELILALSQLQQKEGQSENRIRLAALLESGLRSYDAVTDYSALFYKQEESGGTLGPLEQIYLKFEKPFKIYMGWLNTHKKGLQVVYERGKHEGKLAIHKPGLLLGLVPVVFLEQSSPWVREGSASYDIEDAGIGTFLTEFTNAVLRGERENKLQVEFLGKTTDENFKGEKLTVTFVDSEKDADFFAYRITVVFEETTHLPLWMEFFDWENRKTGIYEYRDLKTNIGLDEEFKKRANRQLLKIYIGKTPVVKTKSQNFGPQR